MKQILLIWGLSLALAPALPRDLEHSAVNHDPDYATLEQRGWQPLLLPGMQEICFAHYGMPQDPSEDRAYTSMLKARELASMYDMGPTITSTPADFFAFLAREHFPVIPWYGWPYFQIGDSPTPLTPEMLGKFKPLHEAGVFCAMEFGEWDYYFHELSSNESWFREVTGGDYERLKHLLKPAGLKGYKTMPVSRQAAYDEMRAYFTERKQALGGNVLSMTGHSEYEAYAAEWGATVVGVELGENMDSQQAKIAFLRGAARQWGKPFQVQVSPWLGNSWTSSGILSVDSRGFTNGLDAGHSLSFARRTWLHSWFAGAAIVNPENSSAIFFDGNWKSGKLNEYGRAAQEDYKFMRQHDRGISYTPIAIVVDHLCGYNSFEGKDWGVFVPSSLALQPKTLFQEQLFPGSDIYDPNNPEAREDVRPTPYGESFDVILTPASSDLMSSYPVLLLTGEINFDKSTMASLTGAAAKGSRILINAELAKREPVVLAQLKQAGTVEVIDTGDATRVITNAKLEALCQEFLPIHVSGDPVDYQINRNHSGWVVEIENNAGVVKFGNKPEEINAKAVAHIHLSCRLSSRSVRDWRTGSGYDPKENSLELAIPAGESRFVEFRLN